MMMMTLTLTSEMTLAALPFRRPLNNNNMMILLQHTTSLVVVQVPRKMGK